MRFADEPEYEPLDMSISTWKKIEPVMVELDDLVLCQNHISISGLIGVLKSKKPHSNDAHLHIVKYNGELWLVNGYHRFTISYIRGYREMYARVFHKQDNPTNK
jgi:hypothetical protein